MGTSDLGGALRKAGLQFLGEWLAITSMYRVYQHTHMRKYVYEQASREAAEEGAALLPDEDWSLIEAKWAMLLPRIVDQDFPVLLRRTTVVMVVSSFEVFLVDSISHVLRHRPDLIEVKLKKRKRKKLSTSQELLRERIGKKLKTLQSIEQKLIYIMREPLRVDPGFPPSAESKIVEIDGTRDLIVHSRAIVNQRYLKKAKGSKFRIGDERPIDDAYVVGACYTLVSAVAHLLDGFAKRFDFLSFQKIDT